jgi:hypothetical protein
VREVFDSGVRAGKYALTALGYSRDDVERVAQAFFDFDRHMLAELAELWDPKIPLDRNTAYIEKSREQSATIEAVLRGELGSKDAKEKKEASDMGTLRAKARKIMRVRSEAGKAEAGEPDPGRTDAGGPGEDGAEEADEPIIAPPLAVEQARQGAAALP